MSVSAAVFESAGQRTEHYVPGVYSRSYNVASPSGVSAGNLCIMGKSAGGKPLSLLEFGSVAEAKQSLVDGELLKAIAYAFNGSNTYIPQRVYAMRVNTGTQSSLTLKSSDVEVLKINSKDYGTHTNQLKLWIQTGSVENSKKLTLVYKDNSYVYDNIIQESFSIKYAGEGTEPTVDISSNSLTLSWKEGSDTKSESISFDDYVTVDQLVTRINDTDNFIATMLDTNSEALTKNLDTLTPVNVQTETKFYSNYAAFVEVLESNEYIGSIEKLTTGRILPENSDGYLYFKGGTIGDYTATQWTEALEKLEVEDIQIISTPSSDNGVHTLIANHCASMSTTVNRKERTCIVGGPTGEDDQAAITKAKGFNSKYVSYVTDSGYAANPLTGSTELINGAMIAVMLAGMESAMAVNMPLTFKTLKLLGFYKNRTISNLEKLIKGGVMVCNPNPDNLSELVCIRAITTFQGSNDLISCERSMVREDLYMNRELRNKYTPVIGKPNTMTANEIIQTLKDAASDWAKAGYIIPSDSNENVWNITVKINGDKIYITFSRYLCAPTNFIFITAINHVYSSTVEV